MAALAGLATVAITGTGDPRFSVGAIATLNSVAAIVLGGVALTGGVGSVLGVVPAAIILVMLNPILTAMGINPNNAQVIQGVLIAGVMMVGGLATLHAGASVMTQSAQVDTAIRNMAATVAQLRAARPALHGRASGAGPDRRARRASSCSPARSSRTFCRQSGMRNTLLQAAPLGILAGAQTILMLTGGIDLSITMIATGSAYVAANQSPNGALIAILMGLTVGSAGGQRQRRGRGRLPRQPADHDAGHVGHSAGPVHGLDPDDSPGVDRRSRPSSS